MKNLPAKLLVTSQRARFISVFFIYIYIWETWESLTDNFGRFMQGNDLNEKCSDVKTVEVLSNLYHLARSLESIGSL